MRPHLFIDRLPKFENLLPNRVIESFWDALWLGIRPFLFFITMKRSIMFRRFSLIFVSKPYIHAYIDMCVYCRRPIPGRRACNVYMCMSAFFDGRGLPRRIFPQGDIGSAMCGNAQAKYQECRVRTAFQMFSSLFAQNLPGSAWGGDVLLMCFRGTGAEEEWGC